MSKKSTELVKSSGLQLIADDGDDYLPAKVENTGIDNLDKTDFKTPRIMLLQGLSPQLQSFPGVALANNFWHSGMNISLGESFNFIPLKVSKRIILFRPRNDQGGGILAISMDARTWQNGGNTKYTVKIKEKKEPVVWDTGKDVISSKLTDFGTHNPDDDRSPPAATLFYEYLVWLPERPELGPCVFSASKTGVPFAKTFNTSLLTLANAGKPTYSCVVKAFPEWQEGDGNKWTVPNYQLLGKATKELYEKAKQLADDFANYKVEYTQADDGSEKGSVIDDEIKF